MRACGAVRTRARAHTEAPLREAKLCGSRAGAVSAKCVCSSAGLPSALNGIDSQPRKKHSSTTGEREDVLLNQGIGLGKSAGRPFLPSRSFTAADIQKTDGHFFFFHWTRPREDVDSRTQKSYSSFFSLSSWMGFSPYVVDDSHRAWIMIPGNKAVH